MPLELLHRLANQIIEQVEIVSLISRAVVDAPPLAVKEGGLIRDGFEPPANAGRCAAARIGSQSFNRTRSNTGITSLKVRFNSVFGYYIEVTRSNLDKVPSHYIRKQTVANGERFITPELKEMEGKILGAEERSVKLEYELFQRVREQVLGRLADIQRTASALAQLDVLSSFAETARLFSYCRPEIGQEGVLEIQEGRHPVLDQNVTAERFVPNDTRLDLNAQQMMLITGPNMAGKSTFIRQVALITLLVYTGSFVPAGQARVDLVDRIFTRIRRIRSLMMVILASTSS